MYPHLADLLTILRQQFAEVIYLSDDDRGEGVYRLDAFVDTVLRRTGVRSGQHLAAAAGPAPKDSGSLVRAALAGMFSALRGSATFALNYFRLRSKLKEIHGARERVLVIAIDHTAVFAAAGAVRCPLLFWSFDALCPDAPFRVSGGLMDKLLARHAEHEAVALIVQDEPRRRMVERMVEHRFNKVILLPVGVKDGSFEQSAARSRAARPGCRSLKVIQNGWIAEIRWSSELIHAYQSWPEQCRLVLHGLMSPDDPVNRVLAVAARQPELSTAMYPGEELSRFLDRFDVGFLGYKECDENHLRLENASLQLVLFLRLGIPVICCATESVCNFVEEHGVGVAVSHPDEISQALETITVDYAVYSRNARALFEERFDLERHTGAALLPVLRELLE
jgi:glycosyltransferase involved in cell wall biosynthesis